jgi:hypothetical protein
VKTNLEVINRIGFINPAQKALYAASLLKAGLANSPQVVVVPKVPAIIGKPEIIAAPAYPARPASAIVPASANTSGVLAGALYKYSPAYPVGTAIPAIAAKAATEAVTGVPAVLPVAEIPAVIAPAVLALKGWELAVQIVKTATLITVEAYLPYASSPKLIGGNTNSIDGIAEITPQIQPMKWLDAPATATPTTLTSEVDTLEKYLYKQALALVLIDPVLNSITDEIKVVNGLPLAVKHISLKLSTANYDPMGSSLQLGKL